MTQMRLVAERPNRHEISQGAFVEVHPKWLDRSQADDLLTHCTTELAWQHREFRDGVTVAALFVERRGSYWGLPGVECWGPPADARRYPGPWSVVAHPPCSVWSSIAPVNEARYGHTVGEDGGCFAAALGAVHEWGGVLEHPAKTRAWAAFGLALPVRGGWAPSGAGHVTEVSQRAYGHRARKATWLYAAGTELPMLDWSDPEPLAWVSFLSNHGDAGLPRCSKREAKSTPPAFRDLLLTMARSVER